MIARKQIHGTLSFYATKIAGMRVSEGNPNRRSFRVTQCNEASLEPKVQGLRFAPVGARGPPDLVRPIFCIELKWWEAFKTRASRYFFNKFVSNYIYQSKAVFTSFRIDKDMTLACRHIDI